MKKAIKFFEEEITRLENAPKINGCEMTDEWAEQIEICKTAKSAIEKQIPKKPIPIFGTYSNTVISCTCPNCGHKDLGNNEFEYDYCESCGQALDWGDTE
jgi:hypothetical protein